MSKMTICEWLEYLLWERQSLLTVASENLSTHTEHQKCQVTHQEWKDQVKWRNSSHCTQNNQGKNSTISATSDLHGNLIFRESGYWVYRTINVHTSRSLFKNTEALNPSKRINRNVSPTPSRLPRVIHVKKHFDNWAQFSFIVVFRQTASLNK